jgi:hypothetical protein
LNAAALIQFEQETAAGHVLDLTTGIAPALYTAQLFGHSGAVPVRIISDQPAYQFDVGARDYAALDDHSLLHESIIAEKQPRVQRENSS